MKRIFSSYPVTDYNRIKQQLLDFGNRFSNFCFLDNHGYEFDTTYECLAACGLAEQIQGDDTTRLSNSEIFFKSNKDWIFGHVAYDYKNCIEALHSDHFDGIGFPGWFFFIPEIVFILTKDVIQIGVIDDNNTKTIYENLISIEIKNKRTRPIILKKRFSKSEYITTVKKLQQHIAQGDCYQVCFCQEFFSEEMKTDPISIFKRLGEISPNPFSAFYKLDDKYLLCASPERFLKKTGSEIISQPIKGTAEHHSRNTEEERMQLENDQKERSENTMIVDLVRNDLSKICERGSVQVKEFLKIYSFPQVHQMISTITGKIQKDILLPEVLTAMFPMGSMTGAPKKKAMEIIEQYEKTKRGLYSGTVGYVAPNGDFDFNVVIRSILYNKTNSYLSVQTGSAITFQSDPEKEYEECLVKLEAMKKALSK